MRIVAIQKNQSITRSVGAVLGYSGAVTSATAYTWYAIYLMQGEADTNVITWTLWALESVLSFFIYRRQTGNDFASYLEEAVASLGCISITLLMTFRAIWFDADIFGPLEWIDGISAVLFLWVLKVYRRTERTGDVWPATLWFQVLLVVSSLPLVRSTWENPHGEPLWPWVIWSTGFALQLTCAYLRREGKSFRTLLTPFNYFFWHAAVGVIVMTSGAA